MGPLTCGEPQLSFKSTSISSIKFVTYSFDPATKRIALIIKDPVDTFVGGFDLIAVIKITVAEPLPSDYIFEEPMNCLLEIGVF